MCCSLSFDRNFRPTAARLVQRPTPNDTETMLRCLVIAVVVLGLPSLSPLAAQTDEGSVGVFPDIHGGRVTASGEVYDPQALTAGHNSLRFGVRLAVTNPANGAEVTVRVNDRGPSPEGRVVNLSRAAADALKVSPGDRVQIRALRFDEPDAIAAPREAAEPPAVKPFVPLPLPPAFVQLGAFRTVANAQKLAQGLLRQGFDPQIRKQGPLLRVYLVAAEADVPALVDSLTALGRRGFLQVSREPEGIAVKVTTE